MADAPKFFTTPVDAVGAVSTANTNFDGTGTIVDIVTGATNGTKIEEVVVVATVNPADGMVNLFIKDGTTYYYYDSVDTGDPATGSATVAPYRLSRSYENLVLKSGQVFAASCTVALTSGVFNVFVHGADA